MIELRDQEDRIEYYMLVTQFLRCSKKNEELFNDKLKFGLDEDKVNESVLYYRNEKNIILTKMKKLLDRAIEVKEK